MADTQSFLNPSRLVASIDISRGSVVSDFGCGPGFFAVPLAEKVGAEGKVYAFDVQPQALMRLRSNARLRHLLNIDAVHADLELPRGTHLKDGVCDLVLIASILHQVSNKEALFVEASRILKPGRMLVVVEWDQSPIPGGPPIPSRISKSSVGALAAASGFQMDREIPAGSHHYCLFFRRN